MTLNRQPDLFATTVDLVTPPALDRATMEKRVRPRIATLLAQAQQAETMPWNDERTRVHAAMFHGMTNWLPEEERDALRAAFTRELDRLGGVPEPPPSIGSSRTPAAGLITPGTG